MVTSVQPVLLSCHIGTARALRSNKSQYAFSARAKSGMGNAKRPTELRNNTSEEQEPSAIAAFKIFIEKCWRRNVYLFISSVFLITELLHHLLYLHTLGSIFSDDFYNSK